VSTRKLPNKVFFWIMGIAASILLSGCGNEYLVLNPKGPVAETQYNLIIISAILCGIVIIPVLVITAFIVYRYRDTADNKAPYKPEWSHNTLLEVVWWGIPVIIIALLGYFTVRDVYALKESPNKEVKPITIQVTALDWKWMFTYPEQGVATVNHLEIPVGVPIHFKVSADAPMNSFWVPQLAGQVYAMAGMTTDLWIQADEPGTYHGKSANFSGEGFSHMQFTVNAKPQAEFEEWVQQTKQSADAMSKEDYEKLREPGLTEEITYSSFPKGLFEEIVAKYSHGHPTEGMDHSGHESTDTGQSGHSSHHQMPSMSPAH